MQSISTSLQPIIGITNANGAVINGAITAVITVSINWKRITNLIIFKVNRVQGALNNTNNNDNQGNDLAASTYSLNPPDEDNSISLKKN